jgi:hypothetical protein
MSFNQHLINLTLVCINTFACPKINQYSTGLFVSYSRKNSNAQKYIFCYLAKLKDTFKYKCQLKES